MVTYEAYGKKTCPRGPPFVKHDSLDVLWGTSSFPFDVDIRFHSE